MTPLSDTATDLVIAAIDAARERGPGETLVVGICGAQGSGKSMLAAKLTDRLEAEGLNSAILSLDDLYLSREARAQMASDVHPLFRVRGVPGTHEVALGLEVLDRLIAAQPVRMPRFDKATDSRMPHGQWPLVKGPVDVVLFEGWCVGAVPQDEAALVAPVNALEATQDADGRWRAHVNACLAGAYQQLFSRIGLLVLLEAPGFEVVQQWRTEQEHELRRTHDDHPDSAIMSDEEVAAFIRYYERLTRHILAEMPGRADLVLTLDEQRHVIRHHDRYALPIAR